MWLTTISCIIFACFISSGLSIPQLNCLYNKKSCNSPANCPKSYPICSRGHCCKLPINPFPFCPANRLGPKCGPRLPKCKPGYDCLFGSCCRRESLPLCPLYRRGPKCSRIGPKCKFGYSCVGGYCCRDKIWLPICPFNRRGPVCNLRNPKCKPGYTCRGGYCCRDDVIPQPTCPIGYLSGPSCQSGIRRCPGGYTCMKGICCKKRFVIPIPRCPKRMIYTGRCQKRSCRIGTCIKGACCLKFPTLPPPIGFCPPQKPGIICPAVYLPPRCDSDADCSVGKKCCKVGCGPADCVPVTPILPRV